MNSLTELNNYVSSLSFEYSDDRYARVIFDRATAENQSIAVNEGETFSLPMGIEITEVINYAISIPKLIVDVSSVDAQGVTVSWPTVPTGCTVTETSDGVYEIDGIATEGIWDQIKQPNINLPTNVPDAFTGNFTISVTVDYYDVNLGAETKEYSVTVSVLDVTYMTTPQEFVYPISDTVLITNTPQIASYLDSEYPGATWTIDATLSGITSIDSFASTSTSGGTFSFNNTTKEFTISGTRAQVNSHLSSLYLDSNAVETDFVVYYALSNNQDSTSDTKSQAFTNIGIQYLTNFTEPSFYYTEDTLTLINRYVQITDVSYEGSGDYTVTITPSDTAAVYTMSAQGSGGSVSFNNSTKVLTIVGTKSVVNAYLDSISIQPESDVDYQFLLSWSVTTPSAGSATKVQQLICGSDDREMSNLSVTRSYTANRGTAIFSSNTPQITDLDITGSDTYSLFLDCSFGDWGVDGYSYTNPYSYSGTKAQVNNLISSITFYPDQGVSSNGTFDLTLQKNGTTIASQTISLTGSSGTYQDARIVSIFASQTWSPTAADVKYANYDLLVVGAGGGGGYLAGGGGGGGDVNIQTAKSFTQGTYTATVGVAGIGGTVSSTTGGTGGNSAWIFSGSTLYSATGGSGGQAANGGSSGSGYAGGTGLSNAGGSGGSSGYAGIDATSGVAGDGRPGRSVTWNGVSTYQYGASGGGGTSVTTGGGNGGYSTNGRGGESDRAPYAGDNVSGTSTLGNGGGGGGSGSYANGAKGADGGILLRLFAA